MMIFLHCASSAGVFSKSCGAQAGDRDRAVLGICRGGLVAGTPEILQPRHGLHLKLSFDAHLSSLASTLPHPSPNPLDITDMRTLFELTLRK